jgi:hypothetical protein
VALYECSDERPGASSMSPLGRQRDEAVSMTYVETLKQAGMLAFLDKNGGQVELTTVPGAYDATIMGEDTLLGMSALCLTLSLYKAYLQEELHTIESAFDKRDYRRNSHESSAHSWRAVPSAAFLKQSKATHNLTSKLGEQNLA